MRIITLVAVTLGVSFIFFMLSKQNVYGEELSQVLAPDKIPDGLKGVDQFFNLGEISHQFNSATFYDTGMGVKPIVLNTEQPNTYGSVWSNMAAGNYLDLSKKQTISMWMYLGKSYFKAGNGLALVLQNDPSGNRAFAKLATGEVAGGETMGVWGAPDAKGDPVDTAKRGIQNSWALEFDPERDYTSKGIPVDPMKNFDNKVKSAKSYFYFDHIAANYPGDVATYGTDFTMNHQAPIVLSEYYRLDQRYLSSGTWRHFKLQWNPIDQSMTYTFNDRNFDGSPLLDDDGQAGSLTRTVPVDIKKLHLGDQTKIRWGFTGTTGTHFENNVLLFESIPSIVEGDAQVSLWDVTQNKAIAQNDAVISGDTVNVVYQLTYASGSKDWHNILAKFKLPEHLQFESGRIDYQNGRSENLSLAELKNQATSLALASDLSSTNPSAKITLTGKADVVAQDTKLLTTTTKFVGDDLIAPATTPEFVIKKPKPIVLSAQGDSKLVIKKGNGATFTGQITYGDGTAVNNQDFTLHTSLDETSEKVVPVSNSSRANGTFQINIEPSALQFGIHTLKAYVVDTQGNRSNAITFTVSVSGTLGLITPKAVSFQPRLITDEKQLIDRRDDWSIVFSNTQAAGTKWTITATADKMKQGDLSMNGDLVYRDPNGQMHILTDNVIPIDSGTKSEDADQVFDLVDHWKNTNSGVFLQVNGKNHPGKYTGNITWSAVNSL